jgi:ribonuclease Z
MLSWSKSDLSVTVLHSVRAVATQILISSRNISLLVDAGDGTLRDLLSVAFAPEGLKGILLTHGHYDHVGGLHSLLGYMKMKKRREALPVLLPEGCRQAESLVENFPRVSSGGMPFTIDMVELRDGDQLVVGPFEIRAYGVTHSSVGEDGTSLRMPALGYRLSEGGVQVAITGDCGDSPSVRELVRGADVALVEASLEVYASESEKLVHLTEDLALEIGSLAREHILIHRRIQ